MSGAAVVIGSTLAIAGSSVAVLSTLAMVVMSTAAERLHYLAPVTSVAGPLVGAGLVVDNGLSLTSGQIALTVLLLALTGPALTAAVARAQSLRVSDRNEEPE